MEALGVECNPSESFGVSLGTGETVQGQGECKSVVVQVQGITIVEDFLPIHLGNSDMILGLKWLETLGNTTAKWKLQKLSFKLGRETVTLKGDASLGRSGITLKAMMRTLRKEGKGYIVEFNYLGAASEMGTTKQSAIREIPEFLAPVIDKYQQVFELPPGLPPPRNQDHHIILKEGTDP